MVKKNKRASRAARQRGRRNPVPPQLPLGLPFRPPRSAMATLSVTQEVKVPINQNVASDCYYSFYPLNPGVIQGIKTSCANATDYRVLHVSAWGEAATATSTQFIGLGNAFSERFYDGHDFRSLIATFRVMRSQKRSSPGGCMQIKWGIPNSPWKLMSNPHELSVPGLIFGVADHGTFTAKVALFEFCLTVQYLVRDA